MLWSYVGSYFIWKNALPVVGIATCQKGLSIYFLLQSFHGEYSKDKCAVFLPGQISSCEVQLLDLSHWNLIIICCHYWTV